MAEEKGREERRSVAVVRRAREKDGGEGDNGGSQSGVALVRSVLKLNRGKQEVTGFLRRGGMWTAEVEGSGTDANARATGRQRCRSTSTV